MAEIGYEKIGANRAAAIAKEEFEMARHTFWNVAQEALKEVLIQSRNEISYEAACANMFWQAVDNANEWGIMFLSGSGETGLFSVYVNNRLSEEQTKQEFTTKLLKQIESTAGVVRLKR